MRNYAFTPDERPTMSAFNQRFESIEELANGLGNEYVWEKHKIITVYDIGNEQDLSNSLMRITPTDEIVYGTDYTYDDSTGEYNITNPQKTTINDYYNAYASTTGTFFQAIHNAPNQKGYSNSNVGIKNEVLKFVNPYSVSSTYCEMNVSAKYRIVSKNTTDEFINFVNSPSSTAYPPAVSDGYTYTALGQLGDKTKIAIGSYTGTETYGESNPNSLTFDFVPKFLILSEGSFELLVKPLIDGTKYYRVIPYTSGHDGYMWTEGNSIIWYSTVNSSTQFNSGTVSYIAIG